MKKGETAVEQVNRELAQRRAKKKSFVTAPDGAIRVKRDGEEVYIEPENLRVNGHDLGFTLQKTQERLDEGRWKLDGLEEWRGETIDPRLETDRENIQNLQERVAKLEDLTNKQAELLAAQSDTIAKIIETLKGVKIS